jgi:hypothetical protein
MTQVGSPLQIQENSVSMDFVYSGHRFSTIFSGSACLGWWVPRVRLQTLRQARKFFSRTREKNLDFIRSSRAVVSGVVLLLWAGLGA